MFGNYFQGQPFPMKKADETTGILRHNLVSGKPGKCQVPFPTFPPRDLCTLWVSGERHISYTIFPETQEELQKWNYTFAQRLSLLNPT